MQSMVPSRSASSRRSVSACSRSGGATLVVAVVWRHGGAHRIIPAGHEVAGQRQVMRRDFRGHVGPARLCLPNQVHGTARGHVQAVIPPAGQLRQQQVAPEHDLLGLPRRARQSEPGAHHPLVHRGAGGQCGVLAVVGDGKPQRTRIFHRVPHQRRVGQRPAVIGEADHASLGQVHHFNQLTALLAAGDRRQWPHAHRGMPLDLLLQSLDDAPRVEHRVGIGHGAHRGEAAGRRRGGAAGDVLFVLEPRRPQMRVHVHESGRDHMARGVDHARRSQRQLGADLADAHEPAIVDQHVADPVDIVRRIDNPAAANDQRCVLSHPGPRSGTGAGPPWQRRESARRAPRPAK